MVYYFPFNPLCISLKLSKSTSSFSMISKSSASRRPETSDLGTLLAIFP